MGKQHAPERPYWAIVMNFGMQGDMAVIITRAKFYVNRFGGLDTPKSALLHRLGWSLLQFTVLHSRATL